MNQQNLKKEIIIMKEDLDDLENYIHEFITFLPISVCIVNLLGKIIGVNKEFEQVSKYKSGDVIGQPMDIIFLEKEKINSLKSNVFKKEVLKNEGLTLITKNQTKVSVNLSIGVRKDPEGKLIGFFLSLWDITELKELQDQLEEKVKKRTIEIQKRVDELETFYRLAVGRELRISELKAKVAQLEEQIEKSK